MILFSTLVFLFLFPTKINLSKTVRQISIENDKVTGLFYENTPPQWTSPSKINDESFFEEKISTESKKNDWIHEDFDKIIVTAVSLCRF